MLVPDTKSEFSMEIVPRDSMMPPWYAEVLETKDEELIASVEEVSR